MERIRDIYVFVCAAIGIFALILAVYQAANNKLGSAVALGTAFVVCGLFVFIPQIKAFKVWGVEAELKETLDRAEEILGKLRRLSLISAKSNYMGLAWSNRMDGPSATEKQAILDDVDRQLLELKVTPDEREQIVRTYVSLIGWDFYQMYIRTIGRYMQSSFDDISRRIAAGDADQHLRGERDRRSPLLAAWRQTVYSDGLFARAIAGDFAGLLKDASPLGILSENDMKIAEGYRAEISMLFKGCAAKGGFTKEAADYYDKYRDLGGHDRKIIELFGYNPSELR